MDTTAAAIMQQWLLERAPSTAHPWIFAALREADDGSERLLMRSFSEAGRYVGAGKLDLPAQELERAERLHGGWRPDRWTVAQLARALLLSTFASAHRERGPAVLDRLARAATANEAVAIHQVLGLLPDPGAYLDLATADTRTNIVPVFEAIALHNPYPAAHFDERAWNHMVLKALQLGSSVDHVQGLGRRYNPRLEDMLVDYAAERRAAGRPLPPSRWLLATIAGSDAALHSSADPATSRWEL